MVDTHAHYDDDKFAEDRDEVLERALNSGCELIINIGCCAASSKTALELAHKYPFVYSAAGIHPEELPEDPERDLEIIRQLAADPKCVAIGEIGLDYYWDKSKKDEQLDIFRRQLEMSLELKLPVIIHDRDAHADCLEAVSDYSGLKGVFHCYSGSAETAKVLLGKGWYLGFDGPITYKNARKSLEVLEMCPLDRILIETDSPYLPPVPFRGKRNDSSLLVYVLEKIAEIKGLSTDELDRITTENAKRLFNIGQE